MLLPFRRCPSQPNMATRLPRRLIVIATQPADQLIATDITRETGHQALGRNDFFSNKVQADDFWTFFVFKVTAYRIADHLAQFVERVCFGEDGSREGFGFKAALGGFLHDEDDFVHGQL